MKGKAIIPLVLGLGIGLFAVKIGLDTLKKAQASNQNKEAVKAVLAKVDIDAFSSILPEMLQEIETADSLLVPTTDRVSSIEELKGRVAMKAIPAGVPILKSMLAEPGTRPGMEGRIPPGYRAVSVQIDEVTGVAYQLQPGDLVDVIVVMDITSSGSRRSQKETIAEVILQKVEVAAIGRSIAAPQDNAAAAMKPAKSATLLVPEGEVPKLHLAATRGKITLSMRGSEDNTLSTPAMAHSNDLLSGQHDDPPSGQAQTDNNDLLKMMAMANNNNSPQMLTSEPAPPHSVTVYRRAMGPTGSVMIERITFENAESSEVIDITDSAISRTARLHLNSNNSDARSRPSSKPDWLDWNSTNETAPEAYPQAYDE